MQTDPVIRYSFIAAVAGLIAFVTTPLTLMVARRLGFTDDPGPHKLHLAPIPVLGGLAIWAAIVGALIVFGEGRQFVELVVIVVGGTIVAVVGLVDDRVGLGPRGKISGQVVAGVVLVFGGVQTALFSSRLLDVVMTVFWVVAITNAINLLDNMDGLAAGVSAASAGSFLLLASLNGQVLVSSLAAALLGACLGFLFYNFYPAVTFMGDTGSMLLGFALAVLGIKLAFPGMPREYTWFVPILVLGVPIFDTILVMISRWRRGVSWWKGGMDHTSHRLVSLGLSHRRVVLALYVIAITLGLASVLLVHVATQLIAWLLVAGITCLGIVLIYVLEHVWSGSGEGQLKQDMCITVVGGGVEFIPVLEAAVAIGRKVYIVLTPVKAGSTRWRETSPELLLELAVCLSKHPGSVRRLLQKDSVLREGSMFECASLINSALQLQGRVLVNLPAPEGSQLAATATEDVLSALQEADLIVMAGDLTENVIPTLLLPAVARAMRRSKRPRVLVHSDPETAMSDLQAADVGDIITHAIAPDQINGPWHSVTDVRNSRQVAQALHRIWMERTRVQGMQQPLSRAMHA